MSKAEQDVLAERQRQIDIEGCTPEDDDSYQQRQLGKAASCYAHIIPRNFGPPSEWPWNDKWWKPKSYRENLVRAGALIIAEIERLDRQCNG